MTENAFPGGSVEIVIRSAGRPFAESVGDSHEAARPTALGMVVGEHVDKIGFFEPTVSVLWKEVACDCVRFALARKGTTGKPLEEIVRGFKIGCFKIAREYGLVSAGDKFPIFASGFDWAAACDAGR